MTLLLRKTYFTASLFGILLLNLFLVMVNGRRNLIVIGGSRGGGHGGSHGGGHHYGN